MQQAWSGAAKFAFLIIFQVILMLPVRIEDHSLSITHESLGIHPARGKAEWVGTDKGGHGDGGMELVS